MELHHFNVSKAPLEGMNLVEASAGTGKTWAITSLYLRLVLEQKLPLSQILVVTYTRAATHELRNRIYHRLQTALVAFELGSNSSDVVINTLLRQFPNHKEVISCLRHALASLDESVILTIHGFCDSVLKDCAFEGAMPFESEVIVDETNNLTEVLNDFWRQNIYSSDRLWVSWLKSNGISQADDLVQNFKGLTGRPYLNFESLNQIPNLAPYESNLHTIYKTTTNLWCSYREEIVKILEDDASLNRVVYRKTSLCKWFGDMDRLLSVKNPDFNLYDKFERFSRFQQSFINSAVNANTDAPQHIFFETCDELAQCFALLSDVYEKKYPVWQRACYDFANDELPRLQAQQQKLSYDRMLVNLHTALLGSQGTDFVKRLRQAYKAVLLDEFQDTDPIQYEIFRTIYAGTGQPVFMVGDPKQAIYSFRGADVFTYLNAREGVGRIYTLDENHRSVPGLVQGINTLFSKRQNSSAFLFDAIEFNSAVAVAEVPEVSQDPLGLEPLIIWPLLRTGQEKPLAKYNAEAICTQAVAAEIVRLLGAPAKLGDHLLRPSDIAVLVTSHDEARKVEDVLQDVDVPAVRVVQESIYETEDALELERVLAAVAQPNSLSLVRAALLTDVFGYSVRELSAVTEIDPFWDDLSERLHRYHERWRRAGFMQMFRELTSTENTFQRLLDASDGERRITNLLHLAEKIHTEYSHSCDPLRVLMWFSTMRDHPPTGDDDALLRLESDQDRVRIMTLHASKGLQFPVVFLPFSWRGGLRAGRYVDYCIFHQSEPPYSATVDFGSDRMSENIVRAHEEELAERLRLLYVGLTRAQSRCYLAWGAVNDAGTSPLAWLLHRPQEYSSTDNVAALATNFCSISDNDLIRTLYDIKKQASDKISISQPPELNGNLAYSYAMPQGPFRSRQSVRQEKRSWQVDSFSSLTRHQHKDNIDLPDRDDRDSFPRDSDINNIDGIFAFPKGARAGTCLHQILEEIDFTVKDVSVRKATVVRILRSHGFDMHWVDIIDNMIGNVLSTSLGIHDSFTMSEVARSQRIDEMEFYYPVSKLHSTSLRKVLDDRGFSANGVLASALAGIDFDINDGYIHGYIDLVFKAKGQYWLVDYKSTYLGNQLEDYRDVMLQSAMIREHYNLQYLLYTVAVHRFLSQRMVNYEYDTHFGGIYYLFLRGMEPTRPGSGVFFDRPSRELVESIDKLFTAQSKAI